MDKLTFGDFTWPVNPEEYREDFVRETPLGVVKRVITGSGAFFGSDAYTNFKALANLFAESGTGTLTHPVFGARTVCFTELKMSQSPRLDYVAYSFEFKEVDENGVIPE